MPTSSSFDRTQRLTGQFPGELNVVFQFWCWTNQICVSIFCLQVLLTPTLLVLCFRRWCFLTTNLPFGLVRGACSEDILDSVGFQLGIHRPEEGSIDGSLVEYVSLPQKCVYGEKMVCWECLGRNHQWLTKSPRQSYFEPFSAGLV